MSEGLSNWIKRSELKNGTFGEFTVYGVQYERNGELAWCIDTSFPDHMYWVVRGEIHGRSLQLLCDPPNETQNGISGVIEIAEDEKEAVLKAIAEWDKPTEVETK
jgi:hypothetical protein